MPTSQVPIGADMSHHAALPDHRRTRDLSHLFELDANTRDRLAGVLKFATHHSGAPITCIAVQDETGQWYNASLGMHLTTPTVHRTLCAKVLLRAAPLEAATAAQVADLRSEHDEHLDEHDAGPQIASYFGVPLTMPTSDLAGTLAVMDSQERVMDTENKRMLAALAQQVARLFATARLRPVRQRALGEFDYPPPGRSTGGDGLLDALDSHLEEAHVDGDPTNVAAIFFDLDSFRMVHETLGRTATTRMVAEIVDRLRIGLGGVDEDPPIGSLTVLSDLSPQTVETIAFQMLSLAADATSACEPVDTRVDVEQR